MTATNTPTARNILVERIRKLLALATSPNEHEAALALSKATELLAAHGISMLDVHESERSPVEQVDRELTSITWHRHLLAIVARFNYCEIVRTLKYGRRVSTAHVIGRPEAIQTTLLLVDWIMPQIQRMAVTTEREHNQSRLYPVSARVWRNEYSLGVVKRLRERLLELRKAQEANSPLRADGVPAHRALVVVEGQAVALFVANRHPFLTKGHHASTNLRTGGFNAGYKDGDKVSLSYANQLRGERAALGSGR